MNALLSSAFVGISPLLATAVAGMSAGFLLALLWTNFHRGGKKPKRKGLLWSALWKKIRNQLDEKNAPVEAGAVDAADTVNETYRSASPCPLCLGHEDPAIGHLLARRRMVQEMDDEICERCRHSQQMLKEEGSHLMAAGVEIHPTSTRIAFSRRTFSENEQLTSDELPEPHFRSKICPRCRERYHLGRKVCGRDGEELVLLN